MTIDERVKNYLFLYPHSDRLLPDEVLAVKSLLLGFGVLAPDGNRTDQPVPTCVADTIRALIRNRPDTADWAAAARNYVNTLSASYRIDPAVREAFVTEWVAVLLRAKALVKSTAGNPDFPYTVSPGYSGLVTAIRLSALNWVK